MSVESFARREEGQEGQCDESTGLLCVGGQSPVGGRLCRDGGVHDLTKCGVNVDIVDQYSQLILLDDVERHLHTRSRCVRLSDQCQVLHYTAVVGASGVVGRVVGHTFEQRCSLYVEPVQYVDLHTQLRSDHSGQPHSDHTGLSGEAVEVV